jgi:hypothetical protein
VFTKTLLLILQTPHKTQKISFLRIEGGSIWGCSQKIQSRLICLDVPSEKAGSPTVLLSERVKTLGSGNDQTYPRMSGYFVAQKANPRPIALGFKRPKKLPR